jgi:molybdopterin converting factor small subunit
MHVRVLFFGATADVTGERQITIEPLEPPTSRDVFEQMVSKYPRLSSHRLLYSVNQQYASGDEIVTDEDEIAIFTAVSGG